MFEDFSFCTECNYYDSKERRCNLFNRQIRVCGCQYGEDKPRNNFERLKNMSMDELAFELAQSGCPKVHFIKDNEFVDCPAEREPSRADCVKCWLEWLKEEVHDS